jgi:hypothetical protein
MSLLRFHSHEVTSALAAALQDDRARLRRAVVVVPKKARDRAYRARLVGQRVADVQCVGCGSPQLETERFCASCAARVRESSRRQRHTTPAP